MLSLLLFSLSFLLGTSSSLPSLHQHDDLQSIIEPDLRISSGLRNILLDNKIIGDILDDFEPSYYIDLSYPRYHESVMLGNDIPVKSVAKRPVFGFRSISPPRDDSKLTFTLVMTDPDATSRDNPKMSEMCHWIITNLTAPTPHRSADLEEGELESYYPPAPPKKTGKHRYVFVLLEGPTGNLKPPSERPHWGYGKIRHGVRDWAKENSLKVVGVNFFFAQHKKQ